MKFIRDIISEKRASALHRGSEPPRAAAPESPPVPPDVITTPRASVPQSVSKPAYQLPLASLVEDDEDILNVLNPMDDDEADDTDSAIAADDFDFGYDKPIAKGAPAIGSTMDEDDGETLAAAEPEPDVAPEDEVNESFDDPEEDDLILRADIGAAMASAGATIPGTPERESVREEPRPETFSADDDLSDDEFDDLAPEEQDFDDLSVAPEEIEAQEPAKVSRAGLFSAIAAADMAVPEDDQPGMAAGLWTGAMPQAGEDRRPMNPPDTIRDPAQGRAAMPPVAPHRPAMPQAPRAPVAAREMAAPPSAGRSATEDAVDVPAPAFGRGNRRAGRVKTRLLGFNGGQTQVDPFATPASAPPEATESESATPAPVKFPVGWLVVVAGPGTGSSFPLPAGVAQIGRGVGQAIRLDLGDTSISRENHAAIAYDSEQRKYYLGHGGKANLVRLNNRPVLSTEEIVTGNTIRIGETTLRFVALCGEAFDWSQV